MKLRIIRLLLRKQFSYTSLIFQPYSHARSIYIHTRMYLRLELNAENIVALPATGDIVGTEQPKKDRRIRNKYAYLFYSPTRYMKHVTVISIRDCIVDGAVLLEYVSKICTAANKLCKQRNEAKLAY